MTDNSRQTESVYWDRDPAPEAFPALAAGVPVLGICRGFQEMNVAFGGTLWQRVREQPGLSVHHEDESQPLDVQYGPAHEVRLIDGGLLRGLQDGERLMVNSLHHQGIRALAPGARIEAVAPDGLIEAFSLPAARRFAVAVQWHPEWKAMDNSFSRALFAAFGSAARERAAA
ncbi:MAG: gamma-glutamyl-gamma-aminobutyrate hydrolase family protein, partial [Proteobacteria bacterium]